VSLLYNTAYGTVQLTSNLANDFYQLS